MSIQGKSNWWIGIVTVHLCKMILLLVVTVTIRPGSWYHVFPLGTWLLLFFLGDLALFFCYWFIKPMWEEGVRIFGFFWNIMIVLFILFTSAPIFWLLGICIVEICILAWPKLSTKMLEETQTVNDE